MTEGKKCRMQNAECSEQTKTTECCFCCSECAETRSNGNGACPCEQCNYVSRVGAECRMHNAKGEA